MTQPVRSREADQPARPEHFVQFAPQDHFGSKVFKRAARTGDETLWSVYTMIVLLLPTKGGRMPADPQLLVDELVFWPEEEIARCLEILEALGKTGRGGIRILEDGTLENARMSDTIAERQQRSEGARGAARARWEKEKREAPASAVAEPTLPFDRSSGCVRSADAMRSQADALRPQCPPNPSPVPIPSPLPPPDPDPGPPVAAAAAVVARAEAGPGSNGRAPDPDAAAAAAADELVIEVERGWKTANPRGKPLGAADRQALERYAARGVPASVLVERIRQVLARGRPVQSFAYLTRHGALDEAVAEWEALRAAQAYQDQVNGEGPPPWLVRGAELGARLGNGEQLTGAEEHDLREFFGVFERFAGEWPPSAAALRMCSSIVEEARRGPPSLGATASQPGYALSTTPGGSA